MRGHLPWREEDLAYLREHWETDRAEDIAKHIGKSTNAIIGKANRLGLPRITFEEVTRRQKVTHARRVA